MPRPRSVVPAEGRLGPAGPGAEGTESAGCSCCNAGAGEELFLPPGGRLEPGLQPLQQARSRWKAAGGAVGTEGGCRGGSQRPRGAEWSTQSEAGPRRRCIFLLGPRPRGPVPPPLRRLGGGRLRLGTAARLPLPRRDQSELAGGRHLACPRAACSLGPASTAEAQGPGPGWSRPPWQGAEEASRHRGLGAGPYLCRTSLSGPRGQLCPESPGAGRRRGEEGPARARV